MAVDTRDRRASCLGFALGGVPTWPNPSGSLGTQALRQHLAYSYPGILAAEAEEPEEVFITWDFVSRVCRLLPATSRAQRTLGYTASVTRTIEGTSNLERD